MLAFNRRSLSFLAVLLQRPGAFEQLGQALQRNALARGSYDGRPFDLMVCIADALEADQGWSIDQSEAWLVRMGLWEEDAF